MKKSEKTRRLIIEKALPIFNVKGYQATSISDITKTTGITKGAIYGHFESKDEVASAAFDYGVNIVLTQLSERIKSVDTAPEKLFSLVNYYREYIEKPPINGGCPVLNSSIEADDNLPFLKAKVVHVIAVIKESLAKIVSRGMIEGQIKKETDANQFAVFFYSTIMGAISLSRIEGDDRSFRQVEYMLIESIKNISLIK